VLGFADFHDRVPLAAQHPVPLVPGIPEQIPGFSVIRIHLDRLGEQRVHIPDQPPVLRPLSQGEDVFRRGAGVDGIEPLFVLVEIGASRLDRLDFVRREPQVPESGFHDDAVGFFAAGGARHGPSVGQFDFIRDGDHAACGGQIGDENVLHERPSTVPLYLRQTIREGYEGRPGDRKVPVRHFGLPSPLR
jgi:hypothetical protein